MPYGEHLGGNVSNVETNDYLYGGKELQQRFGVNLYDSGARFQSNTGAFTSPDPLAEKYYSISPYAYCAGNPVNLVDPEGEKALIYYTENGKTRSFLFTGKETNIPNNSYVRSFVKAYHYNKDNWAKAGYAGQEPTARMVEREEIVKVSNSRTAGDRFNDEYETVYWNHETGMVTDNGVILSPATGLAHESDHANDYYDNPQKHNEQSNTPNKQYGTAEEKRVITGSEQKTARANGEIKKNQKTRTNHNGTTVIVNGVTSTVINCDRTNEFNKQKKKDEWKALSSE